MLTKICKQCDGVYENTSEFFPVLAAIKKPPHTRPVCRTCARQIRRQSINEGRWHRTPPKSHPVTTDPTPIQCSSCRELLPATLEYFWRDKYTTRGIYCCCKKCMTLRARKRYKRVRTLQPQKDLSVQTCRKCNLTLPATEEFFYPSETKKNGVISYCRLCVRELSRGVLPPKVTDIDSWRIWEAISHRRIPRNKVPTLRPLGVTPRL